MCPLYSKYPERTSRPSGIGVPDHRVGFLLMTRPNPLVRTTGVSEDCNVEPRNELEMGTEVCRFEDDPWVGSDN
jgi:hypothetical protein